MATYTYSLSGDFAGNLNPTQLRTEINDDGGIAPNCAVVKNIGNDVDIKFASSLSAGEQTTLNGLVSAHVAAGNYDYVNNVQFNLKEYSSKASNFKKMGSAAFPGSSVCCIKVVSYCDSGPTSYDVKVFDKTSKNIIVQTNLTNTSSAVIDLGPCTNIPSGATVFEITVRKNGGQQKDLVYLESALVNYM